VGARDLGLEAPPRCPETHPRVPPRLAEGFGEGLGRSPGRGPPTFCDLALLAASQGATAGSQRGERPLLPANAHPAPPLAPGSARGGLDSETVAPPLASRRASSAAPRPVTIRYRVPGVPMTFPLLPIPSGFGIQPQFYLEPLLWRGEDRGAMHQGEDAPPNEVRASSSRHWAPPTVRPHDRGPGWAGPRTIHGGKVEGTPHHRPPFAGARAPRAEIPGRSSLLPH